jgi:phospholipid/cholesterol/gamma-HCH transport system substrate-binding protein
METRANYALIGLFTLSVMTAAFLFVYWFSGSDASAKLTPYRIVFTGSVSGLSRGSSVLYNGLRVGEVTSLRLLPLDPSKVVARVEIDSGTPMNVDTKARLEFQGLTGVASIQLSGGTPESKPLVAQDPGQPPVIYADRSDFQDLLESAQRLARKADDVLTRADQVFAENAGAIRATVKNVETFSGALAANSEGVGRFLSSTGAAADRIAALSVDLQTLSDSLDRVVRAVDPQDVKRIVANVREVTDTFASQREAFGVFIADAAKLAVRLNESAVKFDTVLSDASGVLKGIDREKIAGIVDNADRFAKSLGDNSQRVDDVVRNAQELTGKLNKAADKVEGVLASIQTFLGSDETKGALGDVGEMARSIRKLADNLDKRTAEITAGINRVTGPALREYESLAAEGKRTLTDINRTLRSFEKNPQQLLFGAKPSIPEYSGRP